MSDFRSRSKTALQNLSLAAEWMMRRNVGDDHWWRSSVLTDENSDTDKSRPVFDKTTAQQVFTDLIDRGLLVERKVDESGIPAYAMKYDLDGWDKAVSDGRWVRGKWLIVKRNWLLILLTFILTCFLAALENRVVGFIDRCIDVLIANDQVDEADGKPKLERNMNDKQTQKDEPDNSVIPSGGSDGN